MFRKLIYTFVLVSYAKKYSKNYNLKSGVATLYIVEIKDYFTDETFCEINFSKIWAS